MNSPLPSYNGPSFCPGCGCSLRPVWLAMHMATFQPLNPLPSSNGQAEAPPPPEVHKRGHSKGGPRSRISPEILVQTVVAREKGASWTAIATMVHVPVSALKNHYYHTSKEKRAKILEEHERNLGKAP